MIPLRHTRRTRALLIATGAGFALLAPSIARAQTLYTENFNGGQASNGSYANNQVIGGTQFVPLTGNSFIIPLASGNGFMMQLGYFVGATGEQMKGGTARANPLFNLLTNYKYTVSFDVAGFNQGTGVVADWTLTTALGSGSQTITGGYTGYSNNSFSFTSLGNQSQVQLLFTSSGKYYSGVQIDNILVKAEQLEVVTPPTTAVPEPSTYLLMASGLLTLAFARKRFTRSA